MKSLYATKLNQVSSTIFGKHEEANLFAGKFVLHLFLMLLLLVTACNSASKEEIPTDMSQSKSIITPTAKSITTMTPTPLPQPPKLHVEGTNFVDEEGNIVILRGVAIMDPIQLASGWNPDLGPWREDIFRVIHEWGATVVRVPILPPFFYDYGVEEGLKVLDQAILWAAKYDLYVIIDYHGLGFPPDDYSLFDWSASTEKEMIDFWNMVSKRYAGNSVVAFYELYNEPGRDISGLPRLEDWLVWKGFAEEVIDEIRENDPETIIIVGGLRFGNDLHFALEAPIERTNIAYASHPYPGVSRWLPWDKAFGQVSSEFPVLLTEFGFDNDPLLEDFLWESSCSGPGRYRDELINYVEERGISWTVWVFSHTWPCRMLLDQEYTPSELGQFIQEQLLIHSP